jgi:ferredoxin
VFELFSRKETAMNVRIDKDSCVGCGNCVEICPEIFEMDGDLALAKINSVPEDLQGACRDAAESCPVEAVIIEE